MDVFKFDGCRLYTGFRLGYRLRLWTPTYALRAISVVTELLVTSADQVLSVCMTECVCVDGKLRQIATAVHRDL